MPRTLSTQDRPGESLAAAAAGIAALLALTAYLGTLDNPFVLDDMSEVVQNPSLRDPGNLRAFVLRFPSRPLTNVLYLAAYTATRLSPLAYHAISIVLHTLNVVLLFVLVMAMRPVHGAVGRDVEASSVVAAFAAASLFAVHPLMTEAVGYTSSQSELLYSAFFLSSMLCFVRALAGGGRGRLPGWVFFALGLISKETMAVLPLVLVAYDWTLLGGDAEARRARLRRIHAPLLAVVGVLALARIWLYLSVEHPAGSGLQWEGIVLELHVMFRYAALVLWPSGQTIMQPVAPLGSVLDGRVMLALGLLAGAGLVVVKSRAREPLVSFGIMWFFLLLVPSAALIVIANLGQPMAEHRAYLASAGLLMAAGVLTARLWDALPERIRVVPMLGGLTVVLVTLFSLTVVRNRVWEDPVLLWEEATRRAPGAWMAHYGLADAYRASGNHEAAVAEWERVLALSPNTTDAYPPLAEALMALGRHDQARAVLLTGLGRAPSSAAIRQMLASLEQAASPQSGDVQVAPTL